MKQLLIILLYSFAFSSIFAQESTKMTKKGGVLYVPCEINGLRLDLIFDTGATDVQISAAEALFMLKNGYLDQDDFGENSKYQIANGKIEENMTINIKSMKIGQRYIFDVKACISPDLSAPLLLGQSAIEKLGDYSIKGDILYFHDKNSNDDLYDLNTHKEGLPLNKSSIASPNNPFSVVHPAEYIYDSETTREEKRFYLYQELEELYSDVGPYTFFCDQCRNKDKVKILYDTIVRDGFAISDFNYFMWLVHDIGADFKGPKITKDNKFYVAQILNEVNFRAGPGTNYKSYFKLKKDTYVLVNNQDLGGEFIFTEDLNTGTKAYVHHKFLTNYKEIKIDDDGQLTIVGKTNSNTSDIVLENKSPHEVTIKIGTRTTTLKPHETKTLYGFSQGNYNVRAISQGINPYVGKDYIEAGYRYSWTFYVSRQKP